MVNIVKKVKIKQFLIPLSQSHTFEVTFRMDSSLNSKIFVFYY